MRAKLFSCSNIPEVQHSHSSMAQSLPHLTRFSFRAPFEKVIVAVDLNYITVTYTGVKNRPFLFYKYRYISDELNYCKIKLSVIFLGPLQPPL